MSGRRVCDECDRGSLWLRPGRSPFADKTYCWSCWNSWHETCRGSANWVDWEEPAAPPGKHFDFIEVGTSDWGTLTQFFAGEPGYRVSSSLGAEVRTSLEDPRQVWG